MTNSVHANKVEFTEDGYLMQAPDTIVSTAERAAQLVDFNDNYEVAIPKKAGIQVNPWNKFVAYGTNPQTKNPIIIVNADWFLNIPQAQQDFLFARYFMAFKQGLTPLSMKILPYFFMLISFCLALAVFWLLEKTPLANIRWQRVLGTLVIATAFNLLITNNVQIKLTHYLGGSFDMQMNKMALEKKAGK